MTPGGGIHPAIDRIKDPHTQRAVKTLFDRLANMERQTNITAVVISPTAAVDGAGNRVVNLADPIASNDALNHRTLQNLINTSVNDAFTRLGLRVRL
jgi:hypothetical protein